MKAASLLALYGATASGVTPVQKVIQLLDGMHAQGLAEKKDEEVKFSAYSQWCRDTASHKTKAISKAAARIEKLTADIAKCRADEKAAQADIEELTDDVARFENDQKAASAVRGKEAVDFAATNQDYSETLDALDRAIRVLKDQSHDRKQAEFLQKALVKVKMSTTSTVKAAKQALRNFLQQMPAEEANYFERSAPEANAYEFQSGGVVEMMEQLKEKFGEEQSKLEKEEVTAKHAFEQLSQTLYDNIENSNAVIERRKVYKAEREAAREEATGDRADTRDSKAADSKYLADLNAQCEVKTNAFNERQKLRGEELDAIEKATDILASGSVSGASEKHLPQLVQKESKEGLSFLQMGSSIASNEKQSSLQQKVADILSNAAGRYGSKLLAMMSESAMNDPFAKVKKMIKNMIIKLKEEATAETEHKGWCDAELGANKLTRDEKEAVSDELNAEIEQLEATIAKLTQEVSDLTAAVEELDKDRAEATEKRTDEKEKNRVAVKDAKEAQVAVAQALTVLEDFYAKAGKAESFVQGPGEDAPESFNEPYQGMQGESGGVVGMLEVIQSDFARLESETSADEQQAAAEYETFMNDTEVDKAVKQTDIKHKSNMIVKKNSALTSAKRELKTTTEELDAANAYYQKLKPSCVDSGITYEERVKRREEEIQSLKEAMQVLTGMDV